MPGLPAHTQPHLHTLFPCLASYNSKRSITAPSLTSHWTRAGTYVPTPPHPHAALAQCATGAGVQGRQTGKGWRFGEWVVICVFPSLLRVGHKIANRNILLGTSWRSGAITVRGALRHPLYVLVVLGRNLHCILGYTRKHADLCLFIPHIHHHLLRLCISPCRAVRPPQLWMH